MESEIDILLSSFKKKTTRLKDVQKHLVTLKPKVTNCSVEDVNRVAIYVLRKDNEHAIMLFDQLLKLDSFTSRLSKDTAGQCVLILMSSASKLYIRYYNRSVPNQSGFTREQVFLFHLQVLCRIMQNLSLSLPDEMIPALNISLSGLVNVLEAEYSSIDCILMASFLVLHLYAWIHGVGQLDRCIEALLFSNFNHSVDPHDMFRLWFEHATPKSLNFSSPNRALAFCHSVLSFFSVPSSSNGKHFSRQRNNQSKNEESDVDSSAIESANVWLKRMKILANTIIGIHETLEDMGDSRPMENIAVVGILQMRSLQLWISHMLEFVKHVFDSSHGNSIPLDEYLLIESILGDKSELFQSLLSYCFFHEDDPIDAIKHGAREIFERLLNAHNLVCQKRYEEGDGNKCTVMSNLFEKIILEQSWSERAKYPLLMSMLNVSLYSIKQLLFLIPNLPDLLVNLSEEKTMASRTSALYLLSLKLHKESSNIQLQENNLDERQFWTFWLKPIVNVFKKHDSCMKSSMQDDEENEPFLNSKEEETSDLTSLKESLSQYFLPNLLRTYSNVAQFLLELGERNLSLEVICARQQLKTNFSNAKTIASRGSRIQDIVIQSNMYERGFTSWDINTQLEVLGVLVEESRAMIVSMGGRIAPEIFESVLRACRTHFHMLTYFIRNAAAALHSEHYRQTAASLIKQFHKRIFDYFYKLGVDNLSGPSDTLYSYLREYVEIIVPLFIEHANVSAAFHRRTMGLQLLADFVKLLHSFPSKTPAGVLTLTGILQEMTCKLYSKEFIYHLLLHLNDTSTGNKSNSLCMLQEIHELVPLYSIVGSGLYEQIESLCDRLTLGHRPQDGTVAEFLIPLLSSLSEVSSEYEKREFIAEKLLHQLEESIELTSTKGLHWISSHRPFYNTLHCLLSLLFSSNGTLQVRLIETRRLQQRCLDVCYEISNIVSHVVTHVSPEGMILETDMELAGILGPGLSINLLGNSSSGDSVKVHDVSIEAEYLVLCCWRSIKCAAVLVGRLIKSTCDIVHMDEIIKAYEYFRKLLLASKHRGAFELASTGFQIMMEALWRSSDLQRHSLPRQWLQEILWQLQKGDLKEVCVTRRSAGLPHFILSLVISAPQNSDQQRECVSMVMNHMLNEACCQLHLPYPNCDVDSVQVELSEKESRSSNYDESSTYDEFSAEYTVHCLNILRSLYRDSHIGETICEFVADGVRCCIQGYGSSQWDIQNSSTMLFSSLMQRIFGVKRMQDGANKKNKLSAKIFFQRYPVLHDYLLSVLEDEVFQLQKDRNGSGQTNRSRLQPTLMILSQLLPSTNEGTISSQFSLSQFIPLVMECCRSRVWPTRELAARALVSMTHPSESINTWENILRQHFINAMDDNCVSSNELHGRLVQMQFLLNEFLSDAVKFVSSKSQTSAVQYVSTIFMTHWGSILTSLFAKRALVLSPLLEVTIKVIKYATISEDQWSVFQTGLQSIYTEYFQSIMFQKNQSQLDHLSRVIGVSFLYDSYIHLLLDLFMDFQRHAMIEWIEKILVDMLIVMRSFLTHPPWGVEHTFCESFLTHLVIYLRQDMKHEKLKELIWNHLLLPSYCMIRQDHADLFHREFESLWLYVAQLWNIYLRGLPHVINISTQTQISRKEFVRNILQFLLHEMWPKLERYDSRSHVVRFMASLLFQAIQPDRNVALIESNEDNVPDRSLTLNEDIVLFSSALDVICSLMDYNNDVDLRLACVESILLIKDYIYDLNLFTMSSILLCFGSWILALFDDESSVKYVAVQVVSTDVALLPMLALQEGVRKLIAITKQYKNFSEAFGRSVCCRCLLYCQLIDWLMYGNLGSVIHLSDLSSQEIWIRKIREECQQSIGFHTPPAEDKIRVFDRDEQNICSDEHLLLSSLLDVVREEIKTAEQCPLSGCCVEIISNLSTISEHFKNVEEAVKTPFCREENPMQIFYNYGNSLEALARHHRRRMCRAFISHLSDESQ